jgi:hypothetical protein
MKNVRTIRTQSPSSPLLVPICRMGIFPERRRRQPRRRLKKLQRQGNPRPAPQRQETPFGKIDRRSENFYAFFSWPAYFFLNRSTRPAVSMIFCFPVMKG